MTRYFFDLHNDEDTLDEEGQELADDGAARDRARQEALIQAGESVRLHGHLVLHHRIVVRREHEGEAFAVRFGDVVDVRN